MAEILEASDCEQSSMGISLFDPDAKMVFCGVQRVSQEEPPERVAAALRALKDKARSKFNLDTTLMLCMWGRENKVIAAKLLGHGCAGDWMLRASSGELFEGTAKAGITEDQRHQVREDSHNLALAASYSALVALVALGPYSVSLGGELDSSDHWDDDTALDDIPSAADAGVGDMVEVMDAAIGSSPEPDQDKAVLHVSIDGKIVESAVLDHVRVLAVLATAGQDRGPVKSAMCNHILEILLPKMEVWDCSETLVAVIRIGEKLLPGHDGKATAVAACLREGGTILASATHITVESPDVANRAAAISSTLVVALADFYEQLDQT